MKQLNKNKSRLLAMLLTFLMIFSMIPQTAFADATDGNGIPDGTNIARITAVTSFEEGDAITFSMWGMEHSDVPSYIATIPEGTATVEITFKDGECPEPYEDYYTGALALSGCMVTYNEAEDTYTGSGTGHSPVQSEDRLWTIKLDAAGMVDAGKYYGAYDEYNNPLYLLAFKYEQTEDTCPFTSIKIGASEVGSEDITYKGIFELGDYAADEEQGIEDTYDYVHKVPYYQVTVPCGTKYVDVTYSADTNIMNSGSNAYGYRTDIEGIDTMTSATVRGTTFNNGYTRNADNTQTVKTPVKGYTFDAEGNGHAITLEEDGGSYAAVCLFSFIYDGLNHVYEEGVCSCGKEDPNYVPEHKHSYDNGVVTTAPTCTEPGLKTFTCTGCEEGTEGHSYTEAVAALGHTYNNGEITTPATCVATGVKTFTCTVCEEGTTDHTKTETVAKLGHKYDEGVVTTEPTCMNAGVKTYTCVRDICTAETTGHTKTEAVAATGEHTYENGSCTGCGAPAQDENGVYQIGTKEALMWFAQAVNGGQTAIKGVLTADITVDADWPGIGTSSNRFKGTFDGQNYVVSNLSRSLFGYIKGASGTNRAEIKNVAVEGAISGGTTIGGIANNAENVIFEKCINRIDISGTTNLGGIVGNQANISANVNVRISNCLNEGDITASGKLCGGITSCTKGELIVTGCINTGNITGRASASTTDGVGGIVGYMQGYKGTALVENCYNLGKVTNSSDKLVGGLVGNAYNSTQIKNCYNAGEVNYAIAGNVYNNTVKVSNTYYRGELSSAIAPSQPSGSFTNVATKTATEMSSEEFAALLGDAFKQSCPTAVLTWQDASEHTLNDKGACTKCGYGANVTVEYSVTFQAAEGVEFEGGTKFVAGEDYTFSVKIKDGYYEGKDFSVSVGNTKLDSENGTYTVTQPDGPITISVTGVKKYKESVSITPPATGNGYRVNPCNGYSNTVKSGNDYKFTVDFVNGFEAGKDFVVKTKDSEGKEVTLTPDNGVYTIENVRFDQTITVSGVEIILTDDTVSVGVDITVGENEFYYAEETGELMMGKKLDVPYFDLKLYDLEKYYYNEHCYLDENGNKNLPAKVGNCETAYGHVTTIHAFIYMTEIYYLGLDEKVAGTGYSDTIDTDGDGVSDFDESVFWTGGVGSSFMYLWGDGSNLNYHINYRYPLAYVGWGSTSDQQVLKDGDLVSIHFIKGKASGSSYGVFVINDENNIYDDTDLRDSITVRQGEVLTLTHYSADQGENYSTSFNKVANKNLYWVEQYEESADVRKWNRDGFAGLDATEFKTDENGNITIDTTEIEPGTYYIGAAGGFIEGDGTAGADGFVSQGTEGGPAYFTLTVEVAQEVVAARSAAKAEIEKYNAEDYRDAEKLVLAEAKEAANEAIDEATTVEEVEAALEAAKAELDAIKTDAELQELEDAKAVANSAVEDFKAEHIKDYSEYRSEQWAKLQDALAAYDNAISNATTAEEVAIAVETVKVAIGEAKTRDEEITYLEGRLENAIGESAAATAALEDEIANLEKQIDELEAALEDAAGLNATKAELEAEVTGLKEELNKTLENHAAIVTELKTEIEGLTADLEKANELRAEDKAKLEAEIAELTAAMEKADAQNAADKKALEEKVAGLEKSLAALQTEKAELEKQIADLEKTLKETNAANAETKAALEKQIKDLEKKLTDADTANAAEKAELEKQIAVLDKTLKDTSAANAATVAGLEKEIEALETALKDAKELSAKEKAELNAEIASLKETLKQTQESNTADKKALEEKVTALEKTLATVQAEKAELEKEIAELEAALKDVNELNAKEKAELEAKIAELEAALKELSEEQKLAAPTGLKATNIAKTGKIKISWNAVEGAEEYVVYRAKSKNGKYNKVFTTTGTDYTNTNTRGGRTYFYKVKAVTGDKSVDNSDFSEVVKRICKLAKPVVTAKSSKAKQVKVSWKKVKDAKQYVVYRATAKNGKYVKVATTKKLNFTNKKLKSGKTYFYKVKAVAKNANANSEFSAIKKCKAK